MPQLPYYTELTGDISTSYYYYLSCLRLLQWGLIIAATVTVPDTIAVGVVVRGSPAGVCLSLCPMAGLQLTGAPDPSLPCPPPSWLTAPRCAAAPTSYSCH